MLAQVAEIIRNGQRFLVTMHRQPDGDALGSSLAMACALRELGKDVVHYNPDPVPYNFAFLPGSEAIVRDVAPDDAFDATLVFDTGSIERLGPGLPGRDRRGVFINVDHHATTDPYGDVNLVDVSVAAVGVLVHRILGALGHPVSRDSAHGMYASILTDTGSFRYNSTDAECLAVTGDLINAGVSPWEMASRIYESQPAERVRLLGDVLSTLEVTHRGAFASLVVTQDMLQRHRATPEMLDGFVNHARGIDGVEIAALFVEREDGTLKASFRSRGNYLLDELGSRLGGKGKKNAASAIFDCDVMAARHRAADAVGAILGVTDSAVA